jgi:hypothetical protein
MIMGLVTTSGRVSSRLHQKRHRNRGHVVVVPSIAAARAVVLPAGMLADPLRRSAAPSVTSSSLPPGDAVASFGPIGSPLAFDRSRSRGLHINLRAWRGPGEAE